MHFTNYPLARSLQTRRKKPVPGNPLPQGPALLSACTVSRKLLFSQRTIRYALSAKGIVINQLSHSTIEYSTKPFKMNALDARSPAAMA